MSNNSEQALPPRPAAWKKLLVVLGIFMLLGGACFGYLGYQAIKLWEITDLRETDFKSDAERIQLIAQFTKLPIPVEASNIRLHYAGWKDYTLDCTFTLPPARYDAFVKLLQPANLKSDPSAYEVNPAAFTYGTIHIDDTTRTITMYAFTM